MELFKACSVLVILAAAASANYQYDQFKQNNFNGEAEPYAKPWFFEDRSTPYSEYTQEGGNEGVEDHHHHYGGGSSRAEKEAQVDPQVYESPQEAYFVASTKRIPKEDKNYKKAVSPFYTLTDQDDAKYKEIILKSGAPYCQEIKGKVPNKRYRRDAMTCYKCKDPKNGATYEQCSYTSEPREESVVVREYVPIPASFRYRRSSAKVDPEESIVGAKTLGVTNDQFRFGEEYFKPAASEEVVTEYKKEMEHCEKVVKGTMVCMVCKHPQGTGKYEQCSYTKQPNEKAFAYSKSSKFGAPGGEAANGEDASASRLTSKVSGKGNVEEITESPKGKAPAVPTRYENSEIEDVEKFLKEQVLQGFGGSSADESSEEQGSSSPEALLSGTDTSSEAVVESESENSKDGCKTIQKDTMVCKVCKDPKTGGNFEQCSYAHQPKDKVYKFSRSKSFGYPNSGEHESGGDSSSGKIQDETLEGPSKSSFYAPEASSAPKNDYYSGPGEKEEGQGYSDYSSYSPYESSEGSEASESERISEETKKKDCKKVEKEGLTCTVCKDPKTGGDYEQCSYAYQPNDKVFSFSKAKSYGTPEAEGREEEAAGGDHHQGSYGLASDAKPSYAGEGPSESSSEEEVPAAKSPAELTVDFFNTATKKKEIAKVLSEFQQEDRSKCKKVIKDKLTCFQCLDKQGMQTEECLFVAEQEPLRSRVAYRESKEFEKGSEEEEPSSAASEVDEEVTEADEEDEKPLSRLRSEKQGVEKYDGEPEDFEEITKPTYDKVLGLSLPRYMLETSEHETDFDEVVEGSRIKF